MNITQTANILKNEAATAVKEQLLEQANSTETETTTDSDDTPSIAQASTQSTAEQFDTFLVLLTSQIKNQDPLAPLDSTQFVEQLATFSGLELTAKGNNSLERIEGLLAQQIAMLEAEDA